MASETSSGSAYGDVPLADNASRPSSLQPADDAENILLASGLRGGGYVSGFSLSPGALGAGAPRIPLSTLASNQGLATAGILREHLHFPANQVGASSAAV